VFSDLLSPSTRLPNERPPASHLPLPSFVVFSLENTKKGVLSSAPPFPFPTIGNSPFYTRISLLFFFLFLLTFLNSFLFPFFFFPRPLVSFPSIFCSSYVCPFFRSLVFSLPWPWGKIREKVLSFYCLFRHCLVVYFVLPALLDFRLDFPIINLFTPPLLSYVARRRSTPPITAALFLSVHFCDVPYGHERHDPLSFPHFKVPSPSPQSPFFLHSLRENWRYVNRRVIFKCSAPQLMDFLSPFIPLAPQTPSEAQKLPPLQFRFFQSQLWWKTPCLPSDLHPFSSFQTTFFYAELLPFPFCLKSFFAVSRSRNPPGSFSSLPLYCLQEFFALLSVFTNFLIKSPQKPSSKPSRQTFLPLLSPKSPPLGIRNLHQLFPLYCPIFISCRDAKSLT